MNLLETLEALLSAGHNTNARRVEFTLHTSDGGTVKVDLYCGSHRHGDMYLGTFDDAIARLGAWLAHPERINFYVAAFYNEAEVRFWFSVKLEGECFANPISREQIESKCINKALFQQ